MMLGGYAIFPKGQSPKRSFADQIGERITLPILAPIASLDPIWGDSMFWGDDELS